MTDHSSLAVFSSRNTLTPPQRAKQLWDLAKETNSGIFWTQHPEWRHFDYNASSLDHNFTKEDFRRSVKDIFPVKLPGLPAHLSKLLQRNSFSNKYFWMVYWALVEVQTKFLHAVAPVSSHEERLTGALIAFIIESLSRCVQDMETKAPKTADGASPANPEAPAAGLRLFWGDAATDSQEKRTGADLALIVHSKFGKESLFRTAFIQVKKATGGSFVHTDDRLAAGFEGTPQAERARLGAIADGDANDGLKYAEHPQLATLHRTGGGYYLVVPHGEPAGKFQPPCLVFPTRELDFEALNDFQCEIPKNALDLAGFITFEMTKKGEGKNLRSLNEACASLKNNQNARLGSTTVLIDTAGTLKLRDLEVSLGIDPSSTPPAGAISVGEKSVPTRADRSSGGERE
jgi:hypothetical protein